MECVAISVVPVASGRVGRHMQKLEFLGQRTPFVARGFNVVTAEAAASGIGAVDDAEPSFAAPVDQVGGSPQVVGQVGVVGERSEHGRGSAIAVPADEAVNDRGLATA